MSSIFALLSNGATDDEAISPDTEYRMCKVMSVMFAVAVCLQKSSPPLGLRRRVDDLLSGISPGPQTEPHLTALASMTPPTTARVCLGECYVVAQAWMEEMKQKKRVVHQL